MLGDNVVRGVADVVRRSVREVDVVARYGGDEFLLVLPSTDFAGCVTVAERIWREVTERPFFGDPSGPTVNDLVGGRRALPLAGRALERRALRGPRTRR